MRPITLLPEVAKLLHRVLATRFSSILHFNPTILNSAQRAYLHDGSSRQCLHTVSNVCEDFCERVKRDSHHELVLTSYDVKKAFDSIQRFTIEATCRRFNLPEIFIELVLSSLEGAVSQVRTRDGLSAYFDVLTSVRQGDPLAAIIFVLVMDALHEGFTVNPLAPGRRFGYEFAEDGMVPIASSGLADDTAVLSASWEEAELQHLWLLDFFTAHHLRLNSSKSYCIVGSGRGTSMAAVCEAEEARLAYERSVAPGSRSRQDERDALRARHDEARARAAMPDLRFLPDIEEDRVHDPAGGRPVLCGILDAPTPLSNNLIVSRPRSYPFRYLGLMLRVDGHADEAIGVLSGRVWSACRSIRALSLDLVQASDYIREFLYPRLELGLAFTRIPKQVTKSWDSLLRCAVLSVHNGPHVANVASSALLLSMGVLSITQQAVMARSIEMGNVLRGDDPSSVATSVARVKEAIRTGRLATEDTSHSGKAWRVVTRASTGRSCGNRLAGAIGDLIKMEIFISCPVDGLPVPVLADLPGHDARLGCPVLGGGLGGLALNSLCPPMPGRPGTVCVFTDGAYSSPSRGGYAAILCKESSISDPAFGFDSRWCVTLAGSSPLSGRNYTAEWAAIAVALRAVPLNCPLRIYTDALSAMQSASRGLISASQRIRLGARPLTVSCRNIIALRKAHGAPTEFVHVRSHTEGGDVGSRGNAAADAAADRAALASPENPAPAFLLNEERFVF
jgi:ribonuclease HI